MIIEEYIFDENINNSSDILCLYNDGLLNNLLIKKSYDIMICSILNKNKKLIILSNFSFKNINKDEEEMLNKIIDNIDDKVLIIKCEEKIKEIRGTKSRCIPFSDEKVSDKCVVCGKEAKDLVIWGMQY